MKKRKSHDVTVTVGEDTVTVQRGGGLNVAQARLLGDETTGTIRRLYLDRLVHLPAEETLGEWSCSGAISTILSLDLAPQAAVA